jgi:hypothetical protein
MIPNFTVRPERCRRTPTEFPATLLEKVLCALPERVRGLVFTEWHENHLRRLNRHSAPVRILRIFESMHQSVGDDFEADDTEGYQRGAEDHRRSALFQRGHRD